MTWRDLADPGFYASLLVELMPAARRDPSLAGNWATTLPHDEQDADDFEETRPCPWVLTAPADIDTLAHG